MTRREKSIAAVSLVPTGTFVVGLMGWMAWRLSTGLAPLPHGATPFVMMACMTVPLVSVAVANGFLLRQRRVACVRKRS
jgi:uncharacterized membrane-anchored protein